MCVYIYMCTYIYIYIHIYIYTYTCIYIHTYTQAVTVTFRCKSYIRNIRKLNNYVVFISIFILDLIVGDRAKQDVVLQYWIPVHSDDRYDIFDILSVYELAIILLSVQ